MTDMVSPGDIVQTVAILAMMVLPGFLLGKFKLAGDGFATGLSNFVLYVAQSCMFVRAFLSTPVNGTILRRMAIVFVLSAVIHVLFTGIAFLFYRGATTKKCPPAARQRAGAFMLIPLLLSRDYSMPVTV